MRARVFCGMRIAECGKLSRGNLRKIKCGTFRKLPLVAFPQSAAEKFRISADRKTTVRVIAQQMCNRCIPSRGPLKHEKKKNGLSDIAAQCRIVHQTKY